MIGFIENGKLCFFIIKAPRIIRPWRREIKYCSALLSQANTMFIVALALLRPASCF